MEKTTAVITGASTGIGRAIALKLARQGAKIVLHAAQSADRLQQVKSEIESAGGQAVALLHDFSDKSSVTSLVDQAWEAFGDVTHWINNAGGDVLTGEKKEWSSERKLDYLWQVDVRATFCLARHVGRRMIESAGEGPPAAVDRSILNMGWDQAWQGMAGDSGEIFSTVKGAVMAFTKSLAQSLAPQVRVNCLAPGWIKTDWGAGANAYWDQRARRESLADRWGTPQDVAKVASFLCSGDAGFVSGQIVPINGGFRFGDVSPSETDS